MKEHSHCQILERMLRENPHVFIKDIRSWSNYRSRLSDLRPKFALEGLAIVPCIIEGQHAYMLQAIKRIVEVNKMIPAQVQDDLFVGVNG